MSAPELAGQTGSENTAVRPFQVGFPEAEVDELRRRIVATRWPEKETVDRSQGTPSDSKISTAPTTTGGGSRRS